MTDNIVSLSLAKYNLPAITIELMDVGPELASEWLGQNLENRNLRKANVAKYGRDMRAREWHINGSTVVFSIKGVLLDGQHRLNAIVKEGVTVPLLVVRGVAEKAKRTIDDGAKRTMGDRLKIDDIASGNRSVLASLLRRASMWDRGQYINAGGTHSPTASEMYAYLESNPGLQWSAEFAASARRRILAPESVIAIAHWVTARLNSSASEWFFAQLVEATELPSGHPIHALNKKLTAEAKGRVGRANETEMLAAFIITWNHYRAGRSVSQIRMPRDGLKNSNFPLPK